MADGESDKNDKTEDASQRRIQHSYDEGKLPIGKDVAMVAAITGATLSLMVLGRPLRDSLVQLFIDVYKGLPAADFATLPARLAIPCLFVGGICLSSAAASAVATLVQTQGGFWPELALPDFTKLSEGWHNISRILTRDFLVDTAMQVAKISAVAYPAFVTLKSDLTTFGALLFSPADAQLGIAMAPMARATVKALAVMVVVAGLDLALTRYRFMARMKMTKEEAKREHKEDEGDPLIRSKRRRRHRELAKGRAQVEVPRADALVVNPTHIAIAIRYRKSDGRAPRVTAKGKGELAELMRELARSNGIPIVQDIPLARLLFKRVKVGGEVPVETYRAVAAILAFVYRVTGRNPNANANASAGATA